jgi:hypothetical protein
MRVRLEPSAVLPVPVVSTRSCRNVHATMRSEMLAGQSGFEWSTLSHDTGRSASSAARTQGVPKCLNRNLSQRTQAW